MTTLEQRRAIAIASARKRQAESQGAAPQQQTRQPGRSARGQQLRKAREQELEGFLSSLPPGRRELIESVSPLEALAIGMGRGLNTIGAGLGLTEGESEFTQERMEELGTARPALGVGEVVGQALPFVPAGIGVGAIPATAARAGSTAALGATEGALIARGKGEDVETQLQSAGVGGAIAGAFELGLPVIGRVGSKFVRRSLGQTPTTPVVNSAGQPSEELLEALTKEGKSFDDVVKMAREEISSQTDDALTATTPLSVSVDKALRQAAPSIEQLKSQGRSIYNRIDQLGAQVSPNSFDSFVDGLDSQLRNSGFDKGLHPKANAVINRLSDEKGTIKSLSEIDTLRKVAQAASQSLEPDDKRIGGIILNSFDNYLDGLKNNDFIGTSFSGVGKEYKEARRLWGKARRSEDIMTAVNKAKDQASGFENGLRVQFRSILNSKKKSKFFNQDEIAAMKKVVRGTPIANTAKFLGKFGISEQQATSMLGASIGVGGGASLGSLVGGTAGAGVGAVVVPAVGQVSKNLAQKLTKNNANLADLVIRAGKDGRKIVKAYFNAVPKNQRNSAELTQLLMRPDVSLSSITPEKGFRDKIVQDAVHLVKTIDPSELRPLLGLSAAGAAVGVAQQEGNE